jgi:hypothetical protein
MLYIKYNLSKKVSNESNRGQNGESLRDAVTRGENRNGNFCIPGIVFEVLPKFRSNR